VETCVNCGAELVGPFCANCGQKRFVESDRRLGHLLHHFVSSATDLDSRAWRTLRALLFRPGLLSREYFEGRRARWLSPVSIFFAASVLYFIAPLRGGDFTPTFNQQVTGHIRQLALGPDEKPLTPEQAQSTGQFHSDITSSWVERRVNARNASLRAATHGASGYSYHDYRLAYEAKSDDVSKALIMLHLPFAALVLTLLFYRRHRYFAEHVVFLMHYMAFVIIVLQILVQADALYGLLTPAAWTIPDSVLDWTMRVLLVTYAVLSLRRAYAIGWIAAVGAAAVMLAGLMFVNIYIYRAIQFAVTFALT
jgi:hypothetical protein